jgi:hypothetical protein
LRLGLQLATVVAPFIYRRPGYWCEGALKEDVVYNIKLVILALDDPVTGVNFTLSNIGNDRGNLHTLRCGHEKRSTSAKRIHWTSPADTSADDFKFNT